MPTAHFPVTKCSPTALHSPVTVFLQWVVTNSKIPKVFKFESSMKKTTETNITHEKKKTQQKNPQVTTDIVHYGFLLKLLKSSS